jgi:hypothetical protein
MFQDTEGPSLITCGWEDRYSIRSPHPPETFLQDCLSWDPLLDYDETFLDGGNASDNSITLKGGDNPDSGHSHNSTLFDVGTLLGRINTIRFQHFPGGRYYFLQGEQQ